MEERSRWLGLFIFVICFGSWHAWSVVRVNRGNEMIEDIDEVPEKDLDKVRDHGNASVVPKDLNALLDDEEYAEMYSDDNPDAADDEELSDKEIDAIFNRTEEKRRIHNQILMEEQEQEERIQEEIQNADEESLGTFIENSHLSENISVEEFAKDLENITKAEHGPAYPIEVNRKMLKNVPKGMTVKDFEDYVQEEEEEAAEEEAKEVDLAELRKAELEDDTLYDEPDVTTVPADNTRREFVLLDVYENFTDIESADGNTVDFEVEDFLHDKSLNETAFLKEKGLYGRETEWNETFIEG